MSPKRSILSLSVALLVAAGIIGMQFIGGGGRPMFPLLLCYLPVVAAAFLALLLLAFPLEGAVPRPEALFSMLALGGYLIARTCVGGAPGLRDFELLRLGAVFLVYLLFASVLTSSASRIIFVYLMVLSAFFQTMIVLWQFFLDASWCPASLLFPQLAVVNLSTVGTFANKNHTAWLLGDAALLSLALACCGRIKWTYRSLFFYTASFSAVGVILTLSRGGVVALLIGIVCFAVLLIQVLMASANRRILLAGSVAGVVVMLAGALAFFGLMGNARVFTRMQGLWMDTFREDLWRAAVHDVGISPFFGLGASSFQYSARLMMPFESLLAHNDFAQFLSEYGLVGLLLLIAFLAVHFSLGFGAFLRSVASMARRGASLSRTQALLLGLLPVTAAQVIHSFFDFNMHLGANALLAAACFGMLCAPGFHRPGEQCHRALRRLAGAALMSLSFLTAFLLTRDWRAERWFFEAQQVALILPADPGSARLRHAMEEGARAASDQPGNPRFLATIGNLLLCSALRNDGEDESGQITAAAAVLGRAARLDDRDWFVWMRLGTALGRLGNEAKASESFLASHQRLPLFAITYLEHADALQGLSEGNAASHYYRLSTRFEGGENVSRQLNELKEVDRRVRSSKEP